MMWLRLFFVTAVLALPCSAQEQHAPQDLALLDDDVLLQSLPKDADLKNLERQRRALVKGFYWSKENTIKVMQVTDTPT